MILSNLMIQVWLQEFAWTEAKQRDLLAIRNEVTGSESNLDIAAEPMFCFETALKALFWSGLTYDSCQVCRNTLHVLSLV